MARAFAAEGTGSKAQFARVLCQVHASIRQIQVQARWEAGLHYLNGLRDDRAAVVAALHADPADSEMLNRLAARDSTIAAELAHHA